MKTITAKPSTNSKQTNTQELLELMRLQNVQLRRMNSLQGELIRGQETTNKQLHNVVSNTTCIALVLLAPIILAAIVIMSWIGSA